MILKFSAPRASSDDDDKIVKSLPESGTNKLGVKSLKIRFLSNAMLVLDEDLEEVDGEVRD